MRGCCVSGRIHANIRRLRQIPLILLRTFAILLLFFCYYYSCSYMYRKVLVASSHWRIGEQLPESAKVVLARGHATHKIEKTVNLPMSRVQHSSAVSLSPLWSTLLRKRRTHSSWSSSDTGPTRSPIQRHCRPSSSWTSRSRSPRCL